MTELLRNELQTSIGDRYILDRELGRGGMATVYLARDVKHDRLVALKVLDPELGAVLGAERFLSEIRVTATLQHPNLLPLFDSGEAGGLLYYVMPFVEGETLRQRVDREKQLPVDDAVRIAVAVASALGYAHAHGVIHRDLKPENILLQHGQPVIADFGIALAISNAGGARVTQTGLSLGTPQYMSPEQATGDRMIDGRTDVYSLAAVTYEMLGGEPPHSGPTAQAVIAKLVTSEPQPLRALRPSTPRHVAAAVERGLAKLPADRFASAGAFADALVNPAFARSEEREARGEKWRTRDVVLGTLAVGGIASAIWIGTRRREAAPVTRYTIETDSATAVSQGFRWGRVALSPDGAVLVYIGGPRHSLFIRRRDQLRATELPGTERANAPFFSPDGERIGYFQTGEGRTALMLTSLAGGTPVTVTDSIVGAAGATWAPNDTIYTDGNGAQPLVRVAARQGARPELFNVLDSTRNERDATFPDVLPDGKGILYHLSGATNGTYRRTLIAVTEGMTTRHHVVLDNAIRAIYVNPDHLLYLQPDGRLMSVRFDLRTLRTTGDPAVVAEGLLPVDNSPDFAASRNGRLAYVAGLISGAGYELVWVGRDGKETPVDTSWHATFSGPALSPDGTRIAVSTASLSGQLASGPADIWIETLRDGSRFRLTVEGGYNSVPAWSPDGKYVYYISSASLDNWSVMRRSADGAGSPVKLASGHNAVSPLTISADGKWLLYSSGAAANAQIYALRLDDSTAGPVPLAQQVGALRRPMLSPDGRWLAFGGSTNGFGQVFVVPFPDTRSGRWIIAQQTAGQPVWSHSGSELFFRSGAALMSLPIVKGATFAFGKPTRLFSITRYPGTSTVSNYSVSRDDSRFLFVRLAGDAGAEKLTIVENWLNELTRGTRK